MIIVRVTGGLGNQMFQYAMYKSLEKEGCRGGGAFSKASPPLQSEGI